MAAQWVASQQTPQAVEDSNQYPLFLHRLDKIFRTGRLKPADRRIQWRDNILITPDQENNDASHKKNNPLNPLGKRESKGVA